MHYYESPSEPRRRRSQICGFHLENCPRIDGDTTAMHRGRSQKLNKVQHFLSLRRRRRHDGDVGDITINAFPYRRKRPSSIADPLPGHVPVAYDDDMETKHYRYRIQSGMLASRGLRTPTETIFKR